MTSPFSTPYYRATVVLARGCVNAATWGWALIVLCKEDALVSAGANYAWIVNYVPENYLAIGLGLLALVQMIWLVFAIKPIPYGVVGYALLTFCWGFVLFYVAFGGKVMQPTATPWVFVGTALAVYGFIGHPPNPSGKA